MHIGNHVHTNTNCRIVAEGAIFVGTRTMLGSNVCFFDYDYIFNKNDVHSELKRASIAIGERCRLGANTVVTRWTSISNNCLVSAGAVVARDCKERASLNGCVPAQLSKRFREEGMSGRQ